MSNTVQEDVKWRFVSPISIGYFVGARISAVLKQSLNLLSSLGAISVVLVTTGTSIPVAVASAIGAALVLILVSSILSYLCFRFCSSEDSIAVKSGVIRKSQVDVKWDRVRAVNINRGPLDRLFGLSTVSLDTAGTAEAEVVVPGLPIALAQEFRNRLNPITSDEVPEEQQVERELETVVYQVGFKDLVRASFCARGTIVMAGVFLAFLFGSFAQWMQWQSEEWERDLESRIAANQSELSELSQDLSSGNQAPVTEDYLATSPSNKLLETFSGFLDEIVSNPFDNFVLPLLFGIALILLIFLLILFVIFFIQGLIVMEKYHKLQLTFDGEALNSSHGLITKRRVAVEQRRIQTVTFLMNLRERWSKCGTLEFTQSESDDMHKLRIPGVRFDDSARLVDIVHDHTVGKPPLNPKSKEISKVSNIYFWQLFTLYVFLPILVATVVFGFVAFNQFYLLTLAAILLVGFVLAYFQWSKAGFSIGENHIVIRSGFIGYKMQLARLEKVQSVQIIQNLVQTLTGRSTFRLEFSTASLDIPFVAVDKAKKIRQFVLDRIENQNIHWI